jgi:hypothetical protein
MTSADPPTQPATPAPVPPLPSTPTSTITRVRQRRRPWRGTAAVLLCFGALSVLGARIAAGEATADVVFNVAVEQQSPIVVDLRQAVPRSPYVFGMNVFPAEGTRAQDGAYGYMPYGVTTQSHLRGAGITMLRFPGGTWGEAHTPSYVQIDDFLALAKKIHATPLMQVRLAGGSPQQAAALVSYCNNPRDAVRKAQHAAPFLPVHYWVIGNEPDQRGPSYTVQEYVRDFIAYATAMKQADPTIKIFGPEISQYNGPYASPFDAHGVSWLSGFLQGIAAYERAHHVQLLDGISIHRYPFGTTSIDSSSLLFASPDEWWYAIPLLREQIRQTLGQALPILITEINTSTRNGSATSPFATALWWADTLGTLIDQQVYGVDFFAARGLTYPTPLMAVNGQGTPVYRVMQLYTHMGPDVVPVGSQDGTVSIYAATNAKRDVLTLMLINKSMTATTVSLSPQGDASGWSQGRVTLPAYSVACVVLRHGGGDTEYLYAPTAGTLASGQAGAIQIQSLGVAGT